MAGLVVGPPEAPEFRYPHHGLVFLMYQIPQIYLTYRCNHLDICVYTYIDIMYIYIYTQANICMFVYVCMYACMYRYMYNFFSYLSAYTIDVHRPLSRKAS